MAVSGAAVDSTTCLGIPSGGLPSEREYFVRNIYTESEENDVTY